LFTPCLGATVLYAFVVLVDIFIAVWHMLIVVGATVALILIARTSGWPTPPADSHQCMLDPLYRSSVAFERSQCVFLSCFGTLSPWRSFVHFVPFRICRPWITVWFDSSFKHE
jgi:hypothetical protein